MFIGRPLGQYSPLVWFSGCNVLVVDLMKEFRTYVPINRRMKGLRNYPFRPSNNPNKLLYKNSIMSAIIDLESNGHEISELGLIIYDKYGVWALMHEHFKTTTVAKKQCERFVHEPNTPPLYTFQERLPIYTFLLQHCDNVMAKGISLEQMYFPSIPFIDIGNIYQFPKMNDIASENILLVYKMVQKYISPTVNQANGVILVEELRHNPAIECATFWFILNNISPHIIDSLKHELDRKITVDGSSASARSPLELEQSYYQMYTAAIRMLLK